MPGFPNMVSGGMMNGNFPYGQAPYYGQQQVQQQADGKPRGRVCGKLDSSTITNILSEINDIPKS